MLQRIRAYLIWRLILLHPRFHGVVNRIRAPDREEDITLFGTRLRINRRYEAGYYRAFRLSSKSVVLERESTSLITLAALLQPNDTFVDIGANVGLFAAQMVRLQTIYPALRVYAFEANPHTAERLGATLRGKRAEVYAIPLSDRAENLRFVGGAGSLVFGVEGHKTPFQIPGAIMTLATRRLDSFALEGEALVLKIDVEGHERQVLEGAKGLFDQGRIKAVYLDGYEDAAIPAWLASQGMRLFEGDSLSYDHPPRALLAVHHRFL